MRNRAVYSILACLALANVASAQTVDITGLPTPGFAGQVTGNVTGVDFSTHEVAAYLYIEGVGWWTKPTQAMPTVPINPDGSFSASIGTGGVDEFASLYAVAVVPTGTTPPTLLGESTFDPGMDTLAIAHEQRFGTNLNFAGRNWGVKEVPGSAGPGGNPFSGDSSDVWVDGDGLHLTISNNGGQWESTEVVLPENLGYGTYMFQTTSRQDILNANAVFGAFTWDPFGDDERIPSAPFREIDFEDSRWGMPGIVTNSQVVVQPFDTPGALQRITLPDLSGDAALTRFFTWSPGRVEYYSLLGHHDPSDFPESAVIDHTVITENLATGLIIPEPGRENFHFNLWLLENTNPIGNQPVEVVINDFQFVPFLPGDFDRDGDADGQDFLAWQRGESPIPHSASDLADWQANYGTQASAAAISIAPEPSASALLVLLTLFGTMSQRKRN